MQKLIISKIFTFDSAHQLPDEEKYGKCRLLHGHTYKLEVALLGRREYNFNQDKYDWVIDFKELKQIVNDEILNVLDHSNINEVVELSTAENIVIEFIVPTLKRIFNKENPILYSVKLWETPTSYVEWRADLQ